jgi:hypothetical protein
MDPQVQASFIPKKPLTQDRGGRGGAYGLLFLAALLIFITSIVAAGAAFLYTGYLNSSLASKKDSLQKYQDSFDLSTIDTLVRFDTRINEAQSILNNHIAPSAIFFFLAQQTLAKVQLGQFSYSLAADGTPQLDFDGVADSFNTVALQSDQFGANKSLKNVIFTNISVDQNGQVSFHVTADVDPNLILFSKNLTVTPQNSLPPATASSTAATNPATSSPQTGQ